MFNVLFSIAATSVVNISAQINSIPMLNMMIFKVWKEAVAIVLGCIDLDLALRVEKLILTQNNLQEVKIEKWKHSNRMCLMIMKHLISKAFRGFLESKAEKKIREYIMEMSNLVEKLKSLNLELGEDLIVHLVLISLPTYFRKKGCKELRLKVPILLRPLRIIKGRTLRVLRKGLLNKRKLGAKRAKDLLWGEALKIAVYILNKVPTKSINKIPYELWNGKKPSINHFHIWGCPAEARPYRLHERKLDSRTISYYFVGYAECSQGYKFYDPTSRSFFEMENVRILEEVEFGKEDNIRNVVFEEESVNDIGLVLVPITVQETTLTIVRGIVLEQDYDGVLPQTPIEQPQQPQEVSLRRSIRERRHAIPDDYIVFLQEHEDGIGLRGDDPINFCQAMQSSNSQKWIDAMKDELKSMQDNDVWDLVELPEGLLHETKRFLTKNFEMKDLGKTSFVLGIQILRDRSQGILRLSQENYISKVLERFNMKDSKPGDTLIAKGDKFSLKQCPNNDLERNEMQKIPYALVVRSLIYAQVCTRLDITFVVGILGRRTKRHMLTYRKSEDLEIIGYSDFDFVGCQDSKCSTFGYIYMLAGGAISWKFIKQNLIAPSTMVVEFVACFEASNHEI
ncbi:hypothetical protein CR513_02067, partial [Mucuna pruriens]